MKPFLALLLTLNLISYLKAQEIGLELYSLRNQFKNDVPGTLAKIKSWDIKEIEGGGTYGLSMDEYKKLLVKNGLKMISIGANFNDLDSNVQAIVKEAKAFGAKYVMCAWIQHNGDEFTMDDANKAISVFNKAGKVLKENGITFCYHMHGYEFRPYGTSSVKTLFDYIVSRTNPQYVNFEMDVYWVKQAGQNPVSLLKKYPNRFLLLHLKDRKPGTPDSQNGRADEETNVTLGKGDVGIAEIMSTAKKIGVKHYFIEDESSRVEEQIPRSLAFLHGLK